MTRWDGTVVTTTDRLVLRTFREDDLPLYAALTSTRRSWNTWAGRCPGRTPTTSPPTPTTCTPATGSGCSPSSGPRTSGSSACAACTSWTGIPTTWRSGWRLAREHGGSRLRDRGGAGVAADRLRALPSAARHLGHRCPQRAKHRRDAPPRDDVRPRGPARGGRGRVRRRDPRAHARRVARAHEEVHRMSDPVDWRRTALVRRPGPLLAEGLVTHITRHPVDAELAARQWEATSPRSRRGLGRRRGAARRRLPRRGLRRGHRRHLRRPRRARAVPAPTSAGPRPTPSRTTVAGLGLQRGADQGARARSTAATC